MKQLTKLIAASALLAFSSFANAAPITDVYNPTPVSVTPTKSLTFLHDFTDTGYVAGLDSITSAVLTIYLKDNGRDQGGSETFTVRINHDGSTLFTGSDVDNGVTDFGPLSILDAPLQSLSATGQLWFTLAAEYGDFDFVKSSLAVEYTKGTEPVDVPEPLSLTLMGLGLAAIGAARRKA